MTILLQTDWSLLVAALIPILRILYLYFKGLPVRTLLELCIEFLIHINLWFYQTSLPSTFRVIGGWDDLLRLFGLYAMTLLPQLLYGSFLCSLGLSLIEPFQPHIGPFTFKFRGSSRSFELT